MGSTMHVDRVGHAGIASLASGGRENFQTCTSACTCTMVRKQQWSICNIIKLADFGTGWEMLGVVKGDGNYEKGNTFLSKMTSREI